MIPTNFNQLYYFWTVAKAGSISTAAKSLLLDQSTVSLQMKQLEASLGRRLLARSRHGTTLTEHGAIAFEYAERIFTQADELLAALRADRPSAALAFRLGVSQTISRDKIMGVARLINTLERRTPVAILSRSSEELETRLERGMLDMIVSDMDLSVRLGKAFKSRLVMDTPLFFACSPKLRGRAGPFPGCLGRVPLLLRAPENPVRKEVDYFLHRRGIIPDVRAEIENPDLIRVMATRGEGAAITDAGSVRQELKEGRLVRMHRGSLGIRENVWFIFGRETSARPAAAAILGRLAGRFELPLRGAARKPGT